MPEPERASVHVRWRRWWLFGAWYGMIVGAALVLMTASRDATQLAMRVVFLLDRAGPGELTSGARLVTAVSGALTAGLSACAWSLVPTAASDAAADRRIGRGLALGVFVWFVIDSIASTIHGGALNVIGNLTFVIALLPPTLAYARAPLSPPNDVSE